MTRTIACAIPSVNSTGSDSWRYPSGMSIDFETRRQRLLVLRHECGGQVRDLSRRVAKDPTQVSQWLNGHRNISEPSARHIEARMRKPHGWMDLPVSGTEQIHKEIEHFELSPDPFGWPFRVPYQRLLALNVTELRQLDDFMEFLPSKSDASHSAATGARAA